MIGKLLLIVTLVWAFATILVAFMRYVVHKEKFEAMSFCVDSGLFYFFILVCAGFAYLIALIITN